MLIFLAVQACIAVPLRADPQQDVSEFQGYFTHRFAGIPIHAYARGVAILLNDTELTTLMDHSVLERDMETARSLWNKPFRNGKSFSACFESKPPATKYPYFDDHRGEVRTIELDINECLIENGEEPVANLMEGRIAQLAAAYKEQFNEQPMAVELNSKAAVTAYEKGKKLYWTKRGQRNFSCADCHVYHAGSRLRENMLSTGLGHTVGFPAYRAAWAADGNPWGTVHRRYGECNIRAQAKPFAAQSEQYRAIELYEAMMNTGVPIRAPSVRP